MTGGNRERNLRDELARAEECLREAETLRDAGLPYGACSRAYYAVFHAAQALLFSVGIESRSHRGVVGLVGEHFVKPGVLGSDVGRLLARMQRDREDADYLAGAVFTDDEANEMVRNAARVLAEVRRVVSSGSKG